MKTTSWGARGSPVPPVHEPSSHRRCATARVHPHLTASPPGRRTALLAGAPGAPGFGRNRLSVGAACVSASDSKMRHQQECIPTAVHGRTASANVTTQGLEQVWRRALDGRPRPPPTMRNVGTGLPKMLKRCPTTARALLEAGNASGVAPAPHSTRKDCIASREHSREPSFSLRTNHSQKLCGESHFFQVMIPSDPTHEGTHRKTQARVECRTHCRVLPETLRYGS